MSSRFGVRGSGFVVALLASLVASSFSWTLQAQTKSPETKSPVVSGVRGTSSKAKKEDVNRRNADGSTPLQWAVYKGDLAEATRLVRAGADVSLANNYGASPKISH